MASAAVWALLHLLPLTAGAGVGAAALRVVTGHWIWDA